MFERGDVDDRWIFERLQATETVCDKCRHPILESEVRWRVLLLANISSQSSHFGKAQGPVRHEEERVYCQVCLDQLFGDE